MQFALLSCLVYLFEHVTYVLLPWLYAHGFCLFLYAMCSSLKSLILVQLPCYFLISLYAPTCSHSLLCLFVFVFLHVTSILYQLIVVVAPEVSMSTQLAGWSHVFYLCCHRPCTISFCSLFVLFGFWDLNISLHFICTLVLTFPSSPKPDNDILESLKVTSWFSSLDLQLATDKSL